jgi:hypothetical protein
MCPPLGKPVGGIDWGWRNPFAAEWGVLDEGDVLYSGLRSPFSSDYGDVINLGQSRDLCFPRKHAPHTVR